MVNPALFSSNSDEWRTPKKVFDEYNAKYNFTLDAAASDENALCKKYYTKETNGMIKSWQDEIVWLNPPYSEIAKWVSKARMEWEYNNATVVMLIPSRTDTRYWHEHIFPHAKINFIKGRLKFSESKNSAPFPSAIVIFEGTTF